jgi:cytochrome c oxidase assembly protein subunit 15
MGTGRHRLRISPARYRTVTLVALGLLALIVVTGAAVRLTGSGLGCPEWPNCEPGSLTPRSSANTHAMIEFVNRTITGLVSLGVIAAVLGSLLRVPRRRDLVWLSFGLVGGVIAQALLGALVVARHLAPPFVMGHFLLSAVLLANAVWLHHRTGLPDPPPRAGAWGPARRLAGAAVLAASVVLVTGTVVTGAGPHAGDAGTPDGVRAARLDVAVPDAARVHSVSVLVFLGLLLLLTGAVVRAGAPRRLVRPLGVLLGLAVGQAAIGWAQYLTGVPALLVGLHVAGATAVWIATCRLLAATSRGERPAGPAHGDRVAVSGDAHPPVRAATAAAGAALPTSAAGP